MPIATNFLSNAKSDSESSKRTLQYVKRQSTTLELLLQDDQLIRAIKLKKKFKFAFSKHQKFAQAIKIATITPVWRTLIFVKQYDLGYISD